MKNKFYFKYFFYELIDKTHYMSIMLFNNLIMLLYYITYPLYAFFNVLKRGIRFFINMLLAFKKYMAVPTYYKEQRYRLVEKPLSKQHIPNEQIVVKEDELNKDFRFINLSSSIPEIRINSSVLMDVAQGINNFRKHSKHETGYMLVGKVVSEKNKRIMYVSGIIDSGPNATNSHGHVTFDRDYQENELRKIQLTDNVGHIGDIHLHPGLMNYCSQGDFHTDRQNVLNSNTKEMVFGIVTVNPYAKNNEITIDGLSFNFYYLGRESNFTYVEIKPVIINEANKSAVHPTLQQYCNSDPIRTNIDLKMLLSLPQYSVKGKILDGNVFVLQLTHQVQKYTINIVVPDSVEVAPVILNEINNEVSICDEDFLHKWSSLYWLTPIVYEIEKRISSVTK